MAGQGGSPASMFGPYGRIQPLTPPLKGSFPLDYSKECHLEMLKYMCCLQDKVGQNSECRTKARDYFRCRMEKGLMEREEWDRLGYADLERKEKGEAEEENARLARKEEQGGT